MIFLWVFQICAVQFWWIPWALCFTEKSFHGIPQKLRWPQFAAASVISNNNLLFFALVVLWEFVELNRKVDQKVFLLLPFQKITGVHEMRVGTNNANSSAILIRSSRRQHKSFGNCQPMLLHRIWTNCVFKKLFKCKMFMFQLFWNTEKISFHFLFCRDNQLQSSLSKFDRNYI